MCNSLCNRVSFVISGGGSSQAYYPSHSVHQPATNGSTENDCGTFGEVSTMTSDLFEGSWSVFFPYFLINWINRICRHFKLYSVNSLPWSCREAISFDSKVSRDRFSFESETAATVLAVSVDRIGRTMDNRCSHGYGCIVQWARRITPCDKHKSHEELLLTSGSGLLVDCDRPD